MSGAEYSLDVLVLAAIVVPAVMVARRCRQWLAPPWTGAFASLADSIGALAAVVIAGEALGSIGLFRRWTLIATLFALWVAAAWLGRSVRGGGTCTSELHTNESAAREPEVGSRRWSDLVVVASTTALVLAQWSTWVALAFERGIGFGGGPGNGDSLWYHMPFAARFVQSGWTTGLNFLNGEAAVTYYPANSALLHAVGMLAVGDDLLSPLINLALVPIALLAGWCIGEELDIGASTLAGVAVALMLPAVVVSEAGTAKDDVLGLVGLVAAVAFVVRRDALGASGGRRAAAVYGGLAAGLALGSKLTLVAPIAALGVCLVALTPRGERLRTSTRWGLATAATGGYWYVRNLLAIGNPIPGLALGVGRLRLPHPVTPSFDTYGTTLLHNIGDTRVWRDALVPGLKTGFGPAWFVIIAIAAVAIALGVVRLRRFQLVPVIVAALAFAAFVITPGTVWGPQLIDARNVRFVTAGLFAFTLRYMLPAVAVALVIVPLAASRWRGGRTLITVVLGAALLSTQIGQSGRSSWAGGHPDVALPVAAAAAVVVMLILRRAPRWERTPRHRAVAWVAAALLVIAGGWPLAEHYRDHRYAGSGPARWAAEHPGVRIGYSGFVFAYTLYGPHFENRVWMIGQHGPEGSWHAVLTCQAWRHQVHDERAEFVVVTDGAPRPQVGIDLARWRLGLPGGQPPDEPPESKWMRRDPGAHVVLASDGLIIYRIEGKATTKGCDDEGEPGAATEGS